MPLLLKNCRPSVNSLPLFLLPASQSTFVTSATRSSKRSRRTTYRSYLFRKELKAAKMIAMVVGFFVLCVIPIVAVDIAEIACGYPCAPKDFVTFAVCLSYMNPAVNIFAYATTSSDYRKAYKKLLLNAFSCKRKNLWKAILRAPFAKHLAQKSCQRNLICLPRAEGKYDITLKPHSKKQT